MALLTAAEFRSLVPGTVMLDDDALDILLAGAEAAINAVSGPVGPIIEIRDGGLSYFLLARRASEVTEVTERWAGTDTVLDVTDYQLRGGGSALQRLADGLNPSSWWAGQITIEYESEDDIALRKLAQAELVKLEIISNPGLAMQVVGNWTIQFQQGRTYLEIRADILGTLLGVGPVFA